MEKKTKTLFTAAAIACACLLCVFSVSLASYVIGGTVEDQSSNVSVTVEETSTSTALSFTDLEAEGKVVFGPTKGNTSGSITDESAVQGTSEEEEETSSDAETEAAADTESLTVSVSFKVTASSSFSGYVTFSIEPEGENDYSEYVKNGYILDPIAGNDCSYVGNRINVVTIKDGSARAMDHTIYSPNGYVGVESAVSDSSTSGDTLSFSVSLTVTYGWGAFFDYMNPALADEQDNPTNTTHDMITALETMYSDFYDNDEESSDLKLDARIGGRVDSDASLMKAKFDFSSLTASESITESDISGSLTTYETGYSLASSSPVTMSNVSKGNSDFNTGFIQMGASESNGSLALAFGEGNTFTKAVVNAHAYAIDASSADDRGYISVNNTDAQAASTDGVSSYLSYEFKGTNTVTIETTSEGRRAFIFSIELY